MIEVKIRHIVEAARDRPEGYLEAVLKAGVQRGEWLLLEEGVYRHLAQRFPPSNLGMAARALHAACRWISGGAHLTPAEEAWRRAAVCSLCPLWDARAGRCLDCGCTALKTRLETEVCPLGKW